MAPLTWFLLSLRLWSCIMRTEMSNMAVAAAVTPAVNTTSSTPASAKPTLPANTLLPSVSTANTTSPPANPSNGTKPPPENLAAPKNATTPTNTTPLDDPDLETIATRRVEFAVAQQTTPAPIAAWMSSLGADGKWPDSEVDYTTGCPAQRANWPAQGHWQRIGAFAAAWHGGSAAADASLALSADLRAKISSAMDWWFTRDFTEPTCLDKGGTGACPCGTPGLWNTNWFSNVILIPRLVGQTCLLLGASLTPTQLANCTQMTARTYSTFQRAEPPGWLAGANQLDIASIGIAMGLLSDDSSVVADAYARVHAEVMVKTGVRADGILTDGSFGQHGGLLYNGNYGKDYTNDVLELEIEAGDTRLAAEGQSKTAFEGLMDGSKWMIYQNKDTGVLHWDFSVLGRFISFPAVDAMATGSININLTEIQQLADLWDSVPLRAVYHTLTTNASSANVGGLVGTRFFWLNDYLVVRGKSYVTTVKMYSSRTKNTECTNLQNPVGFHLADGAVYTYVKGSEYEDIAAAWDWNLIPGTTVDYAATALSCDTVNQAGVESFVGGASTGKLAAAVMRYTNPLTHNLTFQKTWFHFDNDVQHVMVSGLVSHSGAPVFSVLDQRTHRGPIHVDDNEVSSGNFSHPHTLFHADTGYLFEDAPQLSISAGQRSGEWTAIGTSKQPATTVDLFAAWIAHDAAHLDAPVSYTVFPARSREEFREEAARRPLRPLRNGADVSAVLDREYATAMMTFWQTSGGSVDIPARWPLGVISVSSDSALVAIFNQKEWSVTVADPTQLLTSAQLTFEFGVHGGTPAGWGRDVKKTVRVAFPGPPSAGSSVSLSLLQ